MIFLGTLFAAIFVNNLLLYKLDRMIFFTKEDKIERVFIKGLKIAIVTIFTVLLIYPLELYLLEPNNLEFLTPVIVILVAYGIQRLVTIILCKLEIEAKDKLKLDYYAFLNPVIFTSAVIASLNSSFIVALGYAIGFTIGHLLVSLIILTLTPKVKLDAIHKNFRGIPAMLITVGLIAMAFMGLAGIL